MANVLLIIISLLAGILLRKSKLAGDDAHKILNNIVIYLCIPALSILYIPKIKIELTLLYPLLVTWIVFFLSYLVFSTLGKIYKWERHSIGSLILTSGLCNTSFVGFPVLLAIFGQEGLKIGIIIDQAGSFVLLSTAGIVVASYFSAHETEAKSIVKNIIRYPPFIAFITGLIMLFLNIQAGELISDVLNKIGNTTYLLALVSVGVQLNFGNGFNDMKKLAAGLIFKLIIAPGIIFLLYFVIFKTNDLNTQVSLIESAMPPMVMGSVLATSYNLNPKLSNMMVGIGIPLSIISLFIWYKVILMF